MKVRFWLVLGAVCVVLLISFPHAAAQTPQTGASPVSSGSAEFKREPLKGLDGVGVVVEGVGKEVEGKGLTKEALRTRVELQLRKAGIKLLSESERLAAPGMPILYVNVNVAAYGSGLAAFSVSLQHTEWVSLARNGTGVTAITWSTGSTGIVQGDKLREITERVSELIDKYANEYLAANPIERKGVEEKGKK
jgi:hypothetical protein